MYIQADNVIAYVFLIPTIVSGRITLGIMNQILRAFGQVASSFQFLVSSWTTIIELISIYKRLKAFEAAINDQPLPKIDRDFVEDGFQRSLMHISLRDKKLSFKSSVQSMKSITDG